MIDELFAQRHELRTYLCRVQSFHSADVDDAIASAYEIACHHLDELADHPAPDAWLKLVAKRELFRLSRTSRTEIPASVHRHQRDENESVHLWLETEGNSGLECVAERLALAEAVADGRARWPAYVMQLAGYSYAEICALLGESYTAVNRHITEARRSAQEALS